MYLDLLIYTVIVYIVFKWARRVYLSKKWGCGAPYVIKLKYFGLSFISEQNKLIELGYFLEEHLDQLKTLKRHTVNVNVLGRPVIMTYNSENVKAALATQFNNFSIGVRGPALSPLLGHGIFCSEGDRWKSSREMLRPQFVREQVAHIQSLEPHFQNFIKLIHDDEQIDLQELFHRLTMDASSEFLFGETTGTLIPSNEKNDFEFADNFNDIQDIFTKRIMAGPLYWLVFPNKLRQGIKTIHHAVQYYVNKALETPVSVLNEKSKNGYIFLYELVKITRNPKIIQDELLSILLAGRNTTASLLSFLFFELSRNPRVWEKLKKEVYEQFGNGENVDFESISFETLKRCTYLKYCINEALRMYPPVARNLRVAKKDLCLPRGGGEDGELPLFVAKGTSVVMMIYGMHRQQSVYGKNVDTFWPERWENLKPGWSFMPFGSGPRTCLGQQFALTEASYITLRILQTFPNIKGHDEDYPPRKVSSAVVKLKDGLNVTLSRA